MHRGSSAQILKCSHFVQPNSNKSPYRLTVSVPLMESLLRTLEVKKQCKEFHRHAYSPHVQDKPLHSCKAEGRYTLSESYKSQSNDKKQHKILSHEMH